MKFAETKHGYVINLERGERVLSALTQFCRERGISAGSFTGIGAVAEAEIGFYDLAKKEYFWTKYSTPMEVVALSGNIAALNLEPFIHSHVVLADREMRTYGGHCKEMEVGVTFEIYITDEDIAVTRECDEEIGLNLLNL